MSIQADSLESAAHVVQLALAPVFLLSGIGALLNVFATRLGRVADQANALAGGGRRERGQDIESRTLHRRTRALEAAVVLAALAGALTCGTVLALFLREVGGAGTSSLLFLLFGGAVILTMGALLAYVIEMLLAARSVHRIVGKDEARDSDAAM